MAKWGVCKIKIIVVYGPPCSGKSTYAREHVGEKDIVWDYDEIVAALTEKTERIADKGVAHKVVIALRKELFYQLTEREHPIEMAYILSTWPSEGIRKQLPGAEYTRIEATEEECLDRLAHDDARPDKDRWKALIEAWFQEHENGGEDLNIEIRADGAHISGYVNVTEKKSRPVVTPHGKVIEEIEPRAFEKAINRAGNISLTVDHDQSHIYAETRDGTLTLYEDDIGLHADVLVKDKPLIELAKNGKVRGWSFGMYNVQDEIEPRADDLPLRKIKALDLDHLTLVVNKVPCYSATSVEIRADAEVDIETRTIEQSPKITEAKTLPFFDNSAFQARANALRK